jgi:predicted Zn-dependent protease
MKRHVILAIAVSVAVTTPALAGDKEQLGQIGGAVRRAQQLRDLQVTDQEEQQIGAAVSEKMRVRYGVVQDTSVHKYVTLVGGVLAQASTRPNLPWTFIVLDTDAVNAFAAPGGYVHITKGALALISTEAELAGVLGHEIIHITEKHTIRAMQKSKSIQMGADETLSGNAALLNKVVDNVYLDIIEKGFGRAEENESDEKGVVIANTIGYSPLGLFNFLARLQERNKDATEKRGLFASHPEMKERLDRLSKQIQTSKLASTATLEERYHKNISFKPVPQSAIAVVTTGAAGLTAGGEKPADKPADKPGDKPAATEEKKEEPKKKGFGLSRMLPGGGGEQKSAQANASGGTRGVDPETNAKGGSNPKPVLVKLVAADFTAFKQEGSLK